MMGPDEPETDHPFENYVAHRSQDVFDEQQLTRLAALGLDPEAVLGLAQHARNEDLSGEAVLEVIEDRYGSNR